MREMPIGSDSGQPLAQSAQRTSTKSSREIQLSPSPSLRMSMPAKSSGTSSAALGIVPREQKLIEQLQTRCMHASKYSYIDIEPIHLPCSDKRHRRERGLRTRPSRNSSARICRCASARICRSFSLSAAVL